MLFWSILRYIPAVVWNTE